MAIIKENCVLLSMSDYFLHISSVIILFSGIRNSTKIRAIVLSRKYLQKHQYMNLIP